MDIFRAIKKYNTWQRAVGRSPYTIKASRNVLKNLALFLKSIDIEKIEDITPDSLREYQEELCFRPSKWGGGQLKTRSQEFMLGIVRAFCRWLVMEEYLISDPARYIQLPKKPRPLPKDILEIKEVKKLIKEAEKEKTARGYRNRLILEMLYSTAMRRSELAFLKVADVDYHAGYIYIKEGKGRKDRVVPVGDSVCRLIEDYVLAVRQEFLKGEDDGYLFLNRWGKGMGPMAVYAVVKRYAHLAGIKKTVNTHTFRHTCATHMLREGAHVRHLQEMLGHKSLESTQVYTRVTITELKKVHSKYHPREMESQPPR